jgi:hypothetical protein
MKWPCYIVPSVPLIYCIEYRFLILSWIRKVIFHSRRLVSKNIFSYSFCICIQEIWKCIALNMQLFIIWTLNSLIQNLYSFSCPHIHANCWRETKLAALNSWTNKSKQTQFHILNIHQGLKPVNVCIRISLQSIRACSYYRYRYTE